MFRSLTVFGLLLAAYFFLAYDPRVVVKSEGDLRAERQTAIKRLAEDVDSLGKAAVQADIPRGEELLKQQEEAMKEAERLRSLPDDFQAIKAVDQHRANNRLSGLIVGMGLAIVGAIASLSSQRKQFTA